MQNCWLVLGELFYHYEAGEFEKEITPETHGRELYDQYCEDVNQPIAIETVINKIKAGEYTDKEEFKSDVERIFSNCLSFNKEGSEIYESALSLKFFFRDKCGEFRL